MSENAIQVRRMSLEFPAAMDPVVIEGCPEESFLNVGFSLCLPYVEPFLIRTMRAAQPLVTDPVLSAEIDLFNGQEAQHYKQHARYNEALHLQGFPALKALEAALEDDYRRYTETRSLRFNLAYAEGFEAFTTALGRFTLEGNLADRLHPATRELMLWHLIEELEHRTVVFDVYERLYGGYFYRLVVGGFAQLHLQLFCVRAAILMVRTDPVSFRAKYGGPARAWSRLRPHIWLAIRRLYPKVLATFLPWYSPHKIAMPAEAKILGQRFSKMALPERSPAAAAAEG